MDMVRAIIRFLEKCSKSGNFKGKLDEIRMELSQIIYFEGFWEKN